MVLRLQLSYYTLLKFLYDCLSTSHNRMVHPQEVHYQNRIEPYMQTLSHNRESLRKCNVTNPVK